MKIHVVAVADANGSQWRLALDEHDETSVVVLEVAYRNAPTDWIRIKDITSDPTEVGIEKHRGLMQVSPRRVLEVLEKFMAECGAKRKPVDLIEGMATMQTLSGFEDSPSVEEPAIEGHHRVNLLEYLIGVEAAAAMATRGLWRPATRTSLATVLDAVVTNAPSDPVAESMSPEDMGHVLATQPLCASAMVRKLREAFYLLQDLAKAAQAARGELDNLAAPQERTEEYAARVDMFDRWMTALSERCAAFVTIQVPDYTPGAGPRLADAPAAKDVPRELLVRLARTEAFRSGYTGEHDYLPKHADEADSFQPHEWIIRAMNAAVAAAQPGGQK